MNHIGGKWSFYGHGYLILENMVVSINNRTLQIPVKNYLRLHREYEVTLRQNSGSCIALRALEAHKPYLCSVKLINPQKGLCPSPL